MEKQKQGVSEKRKSQSETRKLRCLKSARCCGAKHISKSQCAKHTTFGHFWTFNRTTRHYNYNYDCNYNCNCNCNNYCYSDSYNYSYNYSYSTQQ